MPTVGSFSTMVFQIEDCLYTVGWNNSKKNLYKYNITKAAWSVDDGFTICSNFVAFSFTTTL